MAITINVIAEDDSTFRVQAQGSDVISNLATLGETTKIVSLLVRSEQGDRHASAELDRRGAVPPELDLGDQPIGTRR